MATVGSEQNCLSPPVAMATPSKSVFIRWGSSCFFSTPICKSITASKSVVNPLPHVLCLSASWLKTQHLCFNPGLFNSAKKIPTQTFAAALQTEADIHSGCCVYNNAILRELARLQISPARQNWSNLQEMQISQHETIFAKG